MQKNTQESQTMTRIFIHVVFHRNVYCVQADKSLFIALSRYKLLETLTQSSKLTVTNNASSTRIKSNNLPVNTCWGIVSSLA